jgi:hypothetical protein
MTTKNTAGPAAGQAAACPDESVKGWDLLSIQHEPAHLIAYVIAAAALQCPGADSAERDALQEVLFALDPDAPDLAAARAAIWQGLHAAYSRLDEQAEPSPELSLLNACAWVLAPARQAEAGAAADQSDVQESRP